jgi:uncharacterized protein (TIGR00251 family)
MSWIGSHKDGITLLLHCQPGAKVTRVVGEHGERLKISLNAPAVDNKANEVLIAWLSQRLALPRKQIELLSGQTSRQKRVLVRDGDSNEIRRLMLPPQ